MDSPSESEVHTAAAATSAGGQSFIVDVNRPLEEGFTSYQTPAAEAEADEDTAVGVQTTPKKKKKKSKSKGKSKAIPPSGFEENYADAPITPAEYAEEVNSLYHPSRSFADRIETCIQRYRARRRFDPERKDVFDKYLSLGGVDTGPKQFSGGIATDKRALDDMAADQIATFAATDAISADKQNSGKDDSVWAVDFEGVAKCFLSSRFPAYFDFDTPEQIRSSVHILRNFLNYVLYHHACPEYEDQVRAARAVCDRADHELVATKAFSVHGPGDFNVACSTLFGGHHQGMYYTGGVNGWAGNTLRGRHDGDEDDDDDDDDDEHARFCIGMSDARATAVFQAGVAALGTPAQQQHVASRQAVHVVSTVAAAFEITAVIPPPSPAPSPVIDHEPATTTDHAAPPKKTKKKIKALGKILARPWQRRYPVPEDHSDDGAEHNDDQDADDASDASYEFWIEHPALLQHCFPGMKMEATVHRLNIGLVFFDAVTAALCSFYTNLPNELMPGWRKPVPVSAEAADAMPGEGEGEGGDGEGEGGGEAEAEAEAID
ncbi:MAG: hypothetical protein M1826_000646 [Phylliscum demangeonii]|nr:MAG: hypothetical protein M1826_000646 [Phylliscum demangeonii]